MAAAAAITGRLTDVRKLAETTPKQIKKPSQLEYQAEVSDIDTDEDFDRIMDLPQDQEQHTNSGAKESPGLPKFTTLKGVAAPLNRSNVDTDAIIPKQFLKTIKRTGLGKALFYEWRFQGEDGAERADFVLNQEPYRNAKILVVTGPNFGCGSSREHAPWALLDFGIKCVIAPSYADIFFNNTFKNGMLPIAIPNQEILEKLAAEASAGRELEIDLVNQVIKDEHGDVVAEFDVEDFRKHCLVNGLDDIGLTMQMEDKIKKFEEKMKLDTPWIGDSGYLQRSGPVKVDAIPIPKNRRGEELQVADW